MCGGDRHHDRKAKPGTAIERAPRFVEPSKSIKDVRTIFWRNSRAVIFDDDENLSFSDMDRYGNARR